MRPFLFPLALGLALAPLSVPAQTLPSTTPPADAQAPAPAGGSAPVEPAAADVRFAAMVEEHQRQRQMLTPREFEVLALLCEGLPNKLIERRLSIGAASWWRSWRSPI